ncbi:hypothetical protein B0H13DRAFT_1913068 [Mycena leptocephala]|nr:hypothetical protein B0H13DRAFT_1913068 [Mycena leptocephala]
MGRDTAPTRAGYGANEGGIWHRRAVTTRAVTVPTSRGRDAVPRRACSSVKEGSNEGGMRRYLANRPSFMCKIPQNARKYPTFLLMAWMQKGPFCGHLDRPKIPKIAPPKAGKIQLNTPRTWLCSALKQAEHNPGMTKTRGKKRYAQERDLGWVKERAYLQKVCNEFHSRVDCCLEDHDEPELQAWDPKEVVGAEQLLDEEEVLRCQRIKLLNKICHCRNLVSGLDPRKDPFTLLLTKLTGLTSPPKIAPVVAERWASARANNEPGTAGKKEPKAGFCASVAREVFASLSDTKKAAISKRVKDEAAEVKDMYEKALKTLPSNKPEDRQRFLGAHPAQSTRVHRLHSMTIVSGPIPKFGGDLRTVHVSVGQNKANAPVHCTQWDKVRFKQHVVKYMVDYLDTAFSTQNTESDCSAAALESSADLKDTKYTMNDDGLDGLDDLNDVLSADESDLDLDLDGDKDEGEDENTVCATKKRKTTKQISTGAKPRNSVDDLPYNELTLEQKITRNKKRNTVLAEGLKEDLHVLFETFPKKKPVPRACKPREKNVPPTRRSRRLANGREGDGDDVASSGDDGARDSDNKADDIDEDGGDERDEVFVTSADAVSSRPALVASVLGGDISSRVSSPHPTDNEEGMDIDGDVIESDGLEMELDTGDKEAEEEGGRDAIPDAPDITVQHPSATSTPPLCLPRAAEWFSHTLSEVMKVNLGVHFNTLLEAWMRMEAACKFENAKPALPKKNRPEQLDGLQPEWQKKDTDESCVVGGAYSNEWDTLTYWGENGLLSVVASLYFWGCAVQDAGNGEEHWERAVNDVAWVLEGLALFYESFKC